MTNAALAPLIALGGKPVDGPVLSGTLQPVLSGTRFPYYRERDRLASLGFQRRIPVPSNLPNRESLGFFLTYPLEACLCEQGPGGRVPPMAAASRAARASR